jgi:hypothetical protein
MCLQLWGRRCGFSVTELQCIMGTCLAVAEHDISRKMDWTLRTDCKASSISRSNAIDYFVWGHLKKHIYAVPPRTTAHPVARLQAAVMPTCYSVFENAMQCPADLKWTDATSHIYCNEAPITLQLEPFDSDVLKRKHLDTCTIFLFYKSHHRASVHTLFHPAYNC